jgi:hypothetical protein
MLQHEFLAEDEDAVETTTPEDQETQRSRRDSPDLNQPEAVSAANEKVRQIAAIHCQLQQSFIRIQSEVWRSFCNNQSCFVAKPTAGEYVRGRERCRLVHSGGQSRGCTA